jgi:hypothetical protein
MNNFKKNLVDLGYSKKIIEDIFTNWGVYTPDENHFIELLNKYKELEANDREYRNPKDQSKYTNKINVRLEVPEIV